MIPDPLKSIRRWKSGRAKDYLKKDVSFAEDLIIGNFRGIKTDDVSSNIDKHYLSNSKNILIKKGVIQKGHGYSTYGNNLPLDGSIMAVFQRKNFEGLIQLFAITTSSLYTCNNGDWEYVTNGQNILNGSNDDIVSFDLTFSETAGDIITIFTNYIDNVKYQLGVNAPDNLFTDWYAKYTRNYEHCQFYAYIEEGGTNYPQKLYWSDIGKPEDVVNGIAGGVVLAKTSDFITNITPLRAFLAIFKERSMSIGRYTGSYNFPFEFEENVLDIGTEAGMTVVNIGDELIFLGNDRNVYITDGVNKKDISVEVRDLLGKRINLDKIHKSFATILKEDKYYLLFIPTEGEEWGYETWLLDFEDWTWQRYSWEGMSSTGFFKVTTGLTIGDLVYPIGQLLWQFGSTITQPGNIIPLLGDKDGYIYTFGENIIDFNDETVESYFDTQDFLWEPELYKRIVQFEIEAKGSGNLELWYSVNEGLTWNYVNSITLTSSWGIHTVNFLVNPPTSKKIRFRIRNNVADNYFYIKSINPKRINKGYIKYAS